MRKLAADALAPANSTEGRVRRVFERATTYPFTGSAVLLCLFLLALTTDAAGRWGLIPFGLLLAFHLRRVSRRGSS